MPMSGAFDRRPLFWAAFVALSLACAALAWKLFPLAMPIVNLDVTMTREAAIAKARDLAREHRLVLDGSREATVFNQDSLAQSYVELEAGGKEAFARLVEGKAYAPYWWEIRLFHPGVVEEASIQLRPDGTLNGFLRRVPEAYVRDPARKALSPDDALALAREQLSKAWGVDLAPYTLLDQSQRTQTTGRVDHVFVFERAEHWGEARVRLEVAVAGDELIGMDPVFWTPQSFERRFSEMRSSNDTIASVATVVAGVLYGLFGCVIAALWLLRRRELLVRPALVAGFVVAILGAFASIAHTPTAWFSFDTAHDVSNFWISQIGYAVLLAVAGGLALGLVFMAAEGLTRLAFGQHPQLWRAWSRDAAGTRAIAGRTFGGYLFVPIELAFVATFYYATNRWLGWWQPSEQLTDPNVLASWFPALSPIAQALQAGMMEECLFRAIPLAGGALIGARFGHRNAGIAIAFVLQAVVFGAAHANYPGFPSYSRLVELVLPSLVWAAIFLRYGLVPTMILHAVFDLVLMSIPLFLIDSAGAHVQRAVVIAAGLVPLGVVLARRAQHAGWTELSAALRNAGWQRGQGVSPDPAPVARAPEVDAGARHAPLLQRTLPVLGLAGLVVWWLVTPLRPDAPSLSMPRNDAIAAAEKALAARGVTLGPEWERMAVPRFALDEPVQRRWHLFVWRSAGPEAYRALVGSALAPPLWDVRFARFDGTVAERAEEWRVTLSGADAIRQVVHRLPEDRAGARLDRAAAQAIVDRTLSTMFGADAVALVPRGADQSERPNRRDWVFAYADPRVKVGNGAEARVQVALAGDEVVAAGRSLFIPETWLRAEDEKDGTRQLARLVAGGITAALAVGVLVYAGVMWSRRRFDAQALRNAAVLVFLMMVVSAVNDMPSRMFGLSTAEPVSHQLVTGILGMAAMALVSALLLGLLAGIGVHHARVVPRTPLATRWPDWACGAFAGLATTGLGAALGALAAPAVPNWPETGSIGSAWPWLGALVSGAAVVPAIAVLLFFLAVLASATAEWTRRLALVGLALVLAGAAPGVLAGTDVVQSLVQGAISGLASFAFAWLLLRYDPATVPAFLMASLTLEAVRRALLAPVADTLVPLAIEFVVAVVLTAWATRYLRRATAQALRG